LKDIDGGIGGEAASQWSVHATEGDAKMEATAQWSAQAIEGGAEMDDAA
jgi:hypothetical protein